MKIKISTSEQLSTQFKSLRKAKGWSQAELGKNIGLKQARVAQIEGDPGSISVDKLLQVLHAIGANLLIETDESGKASRAETSTSLAARSGAAAAPAVRPGAEPDTEAPATRRLRLGRNFSSVLSAPGDSPEPPARRLNLIGARRRQAELDEALAARTEKPAPHANATKQATQPAKKRKK